jgi:hypothetical protein
MGKSGRTSRSRVTRLEPRFGRRRSGKWGSTVRSSGGANGRVVVVLGARVSRGSVQPFYRRTGKGRWSWARHNIGRRSRDKVAARVRRRRRIVARQIAGSRADRWLVGACWESCFGTAFQGRHRWPGGRRLLPFDGTEQGRGEKREGEREGSGFKLREREREKGRDSN